MVASLARAVRRIAGVNVFLLDEKRPPSETHTHETHETRHGKVTQSVIFEVSSEDEFSRMSTRNRRSASRKVGSGPAAAAAIFFRKKFFSEKNFPVSSVMHLDEKLGPSRPAGREVLAFLGGPCTFF